MTQGKAPSRGAARFLALSEEELEALAREASRALELAQGGSEALPEALSAVAVLLPEEAGALALEEGKLTPEGLRRLVHLRGMARKARDVLVARRTADVTRALLSIVMGEARPRGSAEALFAPRRRG